MMKRLAVLFLFVAAAAAMIPISNAAWTDATDTTGTVSSRQPIRVTTYELGLGQFTGTDYVLALDQPLASDYFVMIRGSAGDGNVTSRPSSDSVRVVGDPFGLGSGTSPSQLALRRETATMLTPGTADWRGTVTVVESPDGQTTDGFTLKDIVEITLNSGTLTASAATGASFDSARTVPYGGIRGGGVSTTATGNRDYRAQWARFWVSGTNTVNAEGSGIPFGKSSVYTIYVVQWGANWTIQHAYVNGNDSGDGINSPSEYTTASISTSVARANTWVVAYGHTSSGAVGAGWQGQVFTLGNGVSQNATENSVAIGAEQSGNREADVYVLTHPRLSVSYVFGVDGSIGKNQSTGSIVVPGALAPEQYSGGGVAHTDGSRLSMFANSSNGLNFLYPSPIFWARHESNTSIVWQRARTGQQGAYWAQSVDFGEIWR